MFTRKATMPPTVATLSETLRRTVVARVESGAPIYSLGKLIGCDPSLVSRFLSGKRGLSSATMDRLAVALGLVLVLVLVNRPSPPASCGQSSPSARPSDGSGSGIDAVALLADGQVIRPGQAAI